MVKNIEISGKTIPVNYGLNALGEYSEMRGISINDALNLNMNKMTLMDYLTLVYIGVKDGARASKQECIFGSIDEFLDFADEHESIVTEVTKIFAEYNKSKVEGKKK